MILNLRNILLIGQVRFFCLQLQLDKEEIFGSVEAVKTVSDLFLPVSGEITEMNEGLEDNPELINDDPYGEGWIIKMKISDQGELTDLLSADAYKELIGA